MTTLYAILSRPLIIEGLLISLIFKLKEKKLCRVDTLFVYIYIKLQPYYTDI